VVRDQQILKSAFEADRAPERIVAVIVVRTLAFLGVFVLKLVRLFAHEVVGALLDGLLLGPPASS